MSALAAALLLGVLVGAARLPPQASLLEVLDGVPLLRLHSGLTPTEQAILWQIRLPRVVLAAMVGAMLATAGAAYQGVFRNPLADPYLLGVSSGASLGATVAIIAGGRIGPLDVPLAAFLGGSLGVMATYVLGRSVGRVGSSSVVIVLAGVAVAAFFDASQSFLQQRNDESLLAVYTWMMGRLSTEGWSEVVGILPYFAVAVGTILLYRRTLDVFAVGDLEAGSIGVNVSRARLIIVLAATLGTAAIVSVSGLIGFVGIVVPHAVRLLFGSSHRMLLPLSLLFGGAFLVLADVIARTVAAPAEIPVGVVTAAVGAPFFLVVLRQYRGDV